LGGEIVKDYISFNPRARVGRDTALDELQGELTGFNPRARVGRDSGQFGSHKPSAGFQSTRPRGARPGNTRKIFITSSGFNPRARVGRDLSTIIIL